MKVTPLLIGAVSLVLVGTVVLLEWSSMTSPGRLHPSHAEVAELRGSRGCAACHGKDGQSMADACNVCHTEVAAQIGASRGLHGSLDPVTGRACVSCHSEHTEGKIRLVSELSFEGAGVVPSASYDHRFVPGYGLNGAHGTIQCEQCHTNAHAKTLAKGQKRYLGLTQECTTCHVDAHKGEFGTDCVSCHGQVHDFKKAATFEHTVAFALEGGHAGLKCERCHEKTGPHGVGSLLKASQPVRACVACHEDVHKGALGPDCASCHGTMLPFNQAAEYKHTPLFPLVGGHAGQACKSCHEAEGPRSVASLQAKPLPARECAECHTSPHTPALITLAATTFGTTPKASCTGCHSTEENTFLGSTARMTPALHAATGFALDVPHTKVACVDCHAEFGHREALAAGPDLPARFARYYPGRRAEDCAACHKDPHQGQFSAGVTHGRCIECHQATHFEPSAYDLARHEKSSFPLTGSHRAVGCAMCHKEEEGMRRFVPTTTVCADCHTDVHNGSFDAPGRPKVVDGKEGCVRCHTTGRFGEVAWNGAAHGLWTGYELKGAHAGAACTDCHARNARPDERGRTLAVAPKDCASCHTDAHAGQFRRKGVTDCARCHTEVKTFKETVFDHNRDSSFKLDETHIGVDCASCHKTYQDSTGARLVRYRPLGTQCQDCHDAGMLRAKERK